MKNKKNKGENGSVFHYHYHFNFHPSERLTMDEIKGLLCKELSMDETKFDLSEVSHYDAATGLYYGMQGDLSYQVKLLLKHYLVEMYFDKTYEEVNWQLATDDYDLNAISNLEKIWCYPLHWVDLSHAADGEYVVGKLAKEEEDYDRSLYTALYDEGPAEKWKKRILEDRIVNFAEKMPCWEEDSHIQEEYYALEGMHKWDIITTGIKRTRRGEEDRPFCPNAFRANIKIISNRCGGKKAAQVIRTLQQEWPQIVNWKCLRTEILSGDEVEEFRKCLYEGFERELNKWEKDESEKATEPIKPQKKNSSISKCKPFDSLLLCAVEEKEKVMARLHDLLDGKGGKQVALILMAAKAKDSLLIDMPTEKQYTTEFTLSGTWRAVSDYIKKHTLITGKYQAEFDHITIL